MSRFTTATVARTTITACSIPFGSILPPRTPGSIGHGIGGSGFVRDRDAEFAEQGPLQKEALFAHLDFAITEADRVLSEFDPARWQETTDRVGKPMTYGELILNQVLHFTAHAGQIVFATKLIQDGLIHDVWKSTPMS